MYEHLDLDQLVPIVYRRPSLDESKSMRMFYWNLI
jgi:hypothetical protein